MNDDIINKIKNHIGNLDSSTVIKDGIENIQLGNITIFENNQNLLDAKIFGVPIKVILIITGIYYILKK